MSCSQSANVLRRFSGPCGIAMNDHAVDTAREMAGIRPALQFQFPRPRRVLPIGGRDVRVASIWQTRRSSTIERGRVWYRLKTIITPRHERTRRRIDVFMHEGVVALALIRPHVLISAIGREMLTPVNGQRDRFVAR